MDTLDNQQLTNWFYTVKSEYIILLMYLCGY